MKRSAVLLLVDFFNPLGFEGAYSRATVRAAERTARLKARLAKIGVPAVYANDNFGRWESEFAALVEQCRDAAGDVSRIASLLAPQHGDRSVLKPRHSAFYQTPLMFLLQTLGARTIVLTGVAADACDRAQLHPRSAHAHASRAEGVDGAFDIGAAVVRAEVTGANEYVATSGR
jgi:nicotinamidase-related amidase